MRKNSSVSITSSRLSISISYRSTVKSNEWRILTFGNNPSCPRWIYPAFHAVQVKYDTRDQFEHCWPVCRVGAAEGTNHGSDHYLQWVPPNFSQTGSGSIVESCGRGPARASPSLHPLSAVSCRLEWIIAPERLVVCVLRPNCGPFGCCVYLKRGC